MNHLKIPKPLFKDFIKYTITIVPFSIYISSVDGKLYSIFELPPTKKSIVYHFKFEVRCPVKRYKKNTSFVPSSLILFFSQTNLQQIITGT